MGIGFQQPTIHEKIFGQSSLISRLTLDMLHSQNYGLNAGTGAVHVNVGFLQSPYDPKLTCLTTTNGLPHVLPLSPPFVKAHSERGTNRLTIPLARTGSHLVAAVSLSAIFAPFNRVKLLIQNQKEMLKTGRLSRPYNGFYDCFSRTIKNEGYLSLWRGSSASVIIHFINVIPALAFKDYLKRTYNSKKENDCYWNWFAWNVIAHGASSVTSQLLTYSLEYANTRLATDVKASTKCASGNSSLGFAFTLDAAKTSLANDIKPAKREGKRQFNGLIDVYKKTLQSDGIAGLYRGFNITCVGRIVFWGLSLGFSEFLIKPVVRNSCLLQEHPVFACSLLVQGNKLGAVCFHGGVLLGVDLICYPFETVARRMMMTSGEAIKYKNSWDAFNRIVKVEGPKSLFKGAGIAFFPKVGLLAVTVVLRPFVDQ